MAEYRDASGEQTNGMPNSDEGGSAPGTRLILIFLISVALVLGAGVVVIYAYNVGKQEGLSEAPPLIQSKDSTLKVRPVTPGGLKVPHKDKRIFDLLNEEEPKGEVEKLLPPEPDKIKSPPPITLKKREVEAERPEGTRKTPDQNTPDPVVLPEPPPKPLQLEEVSPSRDSWKIVESPSESPRVRSQSAPLRLTKKKKPRESLSLPKKRFRIQLASLRSETILRKTWRKILKKHQKLLKNKKMFIKKKTFSGSRGTFYRLQVGPFQQRRQAAKLCNQLKAKKQGCFVVR